MWTVIAAAIVRVWAWVSGLNAPPERHRHRCPICYTVWEHADTMRGRADAHRCPTCRHLPPVGHWFLYHGSCPPDRQDPVTGCNEAE